MSNIDYYVNRAIEEIKSESVYRQYTTSLEKLNANPEIKRQVDELRRLNYQAQKNVQRKVETGDYFFLFKELNNDTK